MSDRQAEEPVALQGRLRLRRGTYAGPFADDEGGLSDEYAALNDRTGLSRELYDEIMRWDSEPDHPRDSPAWLGQWHQQQDLLRRLIVEVGHRVSVVPARRQPTVLVRLPCLGTADDGRPALVLHEAEPGGAPARQLPPVPAELVVRVAAWLATRTGDELPNADGFAAEDEASSLVARLQAVLGPDFEVHTR